MKKDELLPLGSIVILKEGVQKVMIISRGSVLDTKNGQVYYDYSSCLHPAGIDKDHTYFFNHEDIASTEFVGYVDEQEEKFRGFFQNWVQTTQIPKGSTEK